MNILLHKVRDVIQKVFRSSGYEINRYDPFKNEKDIYEIQKRLISKQKIKCVFDIGAWVGNTAEQYSGYFPEAVVHAFEPFPDSFSELERKSENPKFNIIPNKLAVSDEIGKSTFHSNVIETTNSLLPSVNANPKHDYTRETKTKIEVDTITIDQYCEDHNIDQINIIKMDIQGAELAALKGATNMLKGSRIDIIFCEVNFIEMYEGSPLYHDLAVFLEEYDYQLHNFYGFYYNDNHQLAWGDAIFKSSAV